MILLTFKNLSILFIEYIQTEPPQSYLIWGAKESLPFGLKNQFSFLSLFWFCFPLFCRLQPKEISSLHLDSKAVLRIVRISMKSPPHSSEFERTGPICLTAHLERLFWERLCAELHLLCLRVNAEALAQEASAMRLSRVDDKMRQEFLPPPHQFPFILSTLGLGFRAVMLPAAYGKSITSSILDDFTCGKCVELLFLTDRMREL